MLLISISGCAKEEAKIEYVAKVGDEYLTREQITEILTSEKFSRKFESELIQEWIKNEVLFKAAKEHGITDESEFKAIIDQSNRKLAGSFYVDKIFEDFSPNLEDKILEDFYSGKKSDFILRDEAYIVNLAEFKSYSAASAFLENFENMNWLESLNDDDRSEDIKFNYFIRSEKLESYLILLALKELNIGETSAVITTSDDKYFLIQLLNVLDAGTIPKFEYVKDDVAELCAFNQKAEFLHNHLEDLYKKYNVEYKKD